MSYCLDLMFKMNKKSIFGTDGIRGLVNSSEINPGIMLRIGGAVGTYITSRDLSKRVIIAKDTRISGYMLEPALTSGLIASGIDVILVGPMPTPSVAMLIKSLRAGFGIMITASHNPYYDNGVKIFNQHGEKLSTQEQEEITDLILNETKLSLAKPLELGRAKRLDDAQGRYIEHVKRSFGKNVTLSGLKIVIDSANGSAYKIAPTVLWELGAEIFSIGSAPNGLNINERCGSVHPELLQRTVLEKNADIGIALDGDADRLVVCDEQGKILEGEILIAIIAEYMHQKNELSKNTIVVTKITNSALESYLSTKGIKVIYSDVGDSKVYQVMSKHDLSFGAEESGHIILKEFSTTGDGIISALQILHILTKSGKKLSDIRKIFKLHPQVKHDFIYHNTNPLLQKIICKNIESLKDNNKHLKVIVRHSGTQKLVRIMVEGRNEEEIDKCLSNLIKILEGQ